MTYEKVDEQTLKVTKEKVETEEHSYKFDFLKSQREAILKQKEEQIAQRDAELAEIDELLAKCDELGIKEKEEKVEEIIKEK